MVREAPFHSIHLKNMLKICNAGGTIYPASPFFYGRPETIDDLINSLICKILEYTGVVLDSGYYKRWDSTKNNI